MSIWSKIIRDSTCLLHIVDTRKLRVLRFCEPLFLLLLFVSLFNDWCYRCFCNILKIIIGAVNVICFPFLIDDAIIFMNMISTVQHSHVHYHHTFHFCREISVWYDNFLSFLFWLFLRDRYFLLCFTPRFILTTCFFPTFLYGRSFLHVILLIKTKTTSVICTIKTNMINLISMMTVQDTPFHVRTHTHTRIYRHTYTHTWPSRPITRI